MVYLCSLLHFELNNLVVDLVTMRMCACMCESEKIKEASNLFLLIISSLKNWWRVFRVRLTVALVYAYTYVHVLRTNA